MIVFDRGVNSDCPVTFIHPIGGYAFGADAAEVLIDDVEEGGHILALRILPGVDVLETRSIAGQIALEEAGLNLVGAEVTEGDPATVNAIVSDYLQRGDIDGVFMDAAATTVAAIEAFEDAGSMSRRSAARTSRTSSIWRPLARSQDALATDGLAHLRGLTG